MKGKPHHIHLKEGSVPSTRHAPRTMPFHWKDDVETFVTDCWYAMFILFIYFIVFHFFYQFATLVCSFVFCSFDKCIFHAFVYFVHAFFYFCLRAFFYTYVVGPHGDLYILFHLHYFCIMYCFHAPPHLFLPIIVGYLPIFWD